jgi:predicted TIM-barrel fold metal-dependent hydrolase
MTEQQLLKRMNGAGIATMALMPRHYGSARAGGRGSDEQALDYAKKHPGRFVAFVGGQREDLLAGSPVWRNKASADALINEFDRKLSTGQFRGLGEFILVHHAYDVGGGEGGSEVRIRADSDLMRRMAALAAKHHVPLVFHAEAEPEPAKQVEALIAAEPKARFVWAHNCGRASAEATAARLERFPNLMCDLGHMFNGPRTEGGYGKRWPRKTPWNFMVQDDAGRVLPEMKRLFETFPDRFMIGTDTAHTPALKAYGYRIAIFRVMLAQLSPDAARKIGAENARRIFARSTDE